MPRTSNGQKEDADTANASPTASATGRPPTSTLATRGTAMARTVPSLKCRTPRDGRTSWVRTPATAMVSPDAVDRNAAKAPPATRAPSRSPPTPPIMRSGSRRTARVGVAGEGEFGGVQAAEGAVDGWEEVEGADQAEDGDRGAAGGDTVRAGVEADDDVRQTHGAEEGGEDEAVRRVQRALLAARGEGGRHAAVGASVGDGDGGALREGEAGAALDVVGAGGVGAWPRCGGGCRPCRSR